MKIDDLNPKQRKMFFNGHCKHRMPYSQHPRCFEKEQNIKIKMGYFDIESGGFNADFDEMLCYSIKTRDEDEILSCALEEEDFKNMTYDKRICKQLIKDLQKYDIILTYNGARFDLPFVRARCLHHGLKFPEFGAIKHKDVYYMVRNKLKIHRNSLEAACELLHVKGKNHIRGTLWVKAKHGDIQALSYIKDHCNRDVCILEKVHKKMERFVRNTVKSI